MEFARLERAVRCTAVGFGLLCSGAGLADTAPGVTRTEIKVGQTLPYSGPASAWGVQGKVASAYIAHINTEGGVNGRRIDLISLDDAYSPPKTVEQTRKLVESDEVFMLSGSLGTATNVAVQRYLNAKKVPQLFVVSGSSRFAKPKANPWSIGWLPSYTTEATILAKHVLATVANPRVAILYQSDDFGKEMLAGIEATFAARGAEVIVAKQSYEPTTPTVDSQIVTLAATGANVFFNLAAPKFAAQAIRKSHEIGWKPTQLVSNISGSIVSVLKPAGLDASRGLLSAAYAKDPGDPQWQDDAAVKAYKAFMQAHVPELDLYDTSAVTGYSTTQSLVEVLKRAGNAPTREDVMKIATNLHELSLPMFLPGVTLDTRPDDYLTIRKERVRRFDGTQWQIIGDLVSR